MPSRSSFLAPQSTCTKWTSRRSGKRKDLYLKEFGGLFSLDDLHFTETGYAFYANLFIRKINETLDTGIPEIDTAEVFARDSLASRNFSDEVLDVAGIPYK